MNWNYRLLRAGGQYHVALVAYNRDGTPFYFAPAGEDLVDPDAKQVKRRYRMMAEAFQHEAIDWEEWHRQFGHIDTEELLATLLPDAANIPLEVPEHLKGRENGDPELVAWLRGEAERLVEEGKL